MRLYLTFVGLVCCGQRCQFGATRASRTYAGGGAAECAPTSDGAVLATTPASAAVPPLSSTLAFDRRPRRACPPRWEPARCTLPPQDPMTRLVLIFECVLCIHFSEGAARAAHCGPDLGPSRPGQAILPRAACRLTVAARGASQGGPDASRCGTGEWQAWAPRGVEARPKSFLRLGATAPGRVCPAGSPRPGVRSSAGSWPAWRPRARVTRQNRSPYPNRGGTETRLYSGLAAGAVGGTPTEPGWGRATWACRV